MMAYVLTVFFFANIFLILLNCNLLATREDFCHLLITFANNLGLDQA